MFCENIEVAGSCPQLLAKAGILALSQDVLKFIKTQANTVDDILLNAYGTMYKFSIKQAIAAEAEYLLSPTEEMLSAKNFFSNLWSVLDFCCIILFSYHNNKLPTLMQGRKIKFPCNFLEVESLDEWEKQRLSEVLQLNVNSYMYSSLKGIFQHVHFKTSVEGGDNNKIIYFYLLHYLRNTLTHYTVDIGYGRNVEKVIPKVWKNLEREVYVSSVVNVPDKPWDDSSRNDRSAYKPKVFVDVLYHCCEVVEECRDRMLHTIPQLKPFRDKYKFELTRDKLAVTLKSQRITFHHKILHLECYGMEAELKEPLEEIRKH